MMTAIMNPKPAIGRIKNGEKDVAYHAASLFLSKCKKEMSDHFNRPTIANYLSLF